ncbi:hypothetical protein EV1_004249 [Malus domestica]
MKEEGLYLLLKLMGRRRRLAEEEEGCCRALSCCGCCSHGGEKEGGQDRISGLAPRVRKVSGAELRVRTDSDSDKRA